MNEEERCRRKTIRLWRQEPGDEKRFKAWGMMTCVRCHEEVKWKKYRKNAHRRQWFWSSRVQMNLARGGFFGSRCQMSVEWEFSRKWGRINSQNIWLSSGEERQNQNGWWQTRMCLQGLVYVHFAWEGLCVHLLICCWRFMMKRTEAGGANVRNPVENMRPEGWEDWDDRRSWDIEPRWES